MSYWHSVSKLSLDAQNFKSFESRDAHEQDSHDTDGPVRPF